MLGINYLLDFQIQSSLVHFHHRGTPLFVYSIDSKEDSHDCEKKATSWASISDWCGERLSRLEKKRRKHKIEESLNIIKKQITLLGTTGID